MPKKKIQTYRKNSIFRLKIHIFRLQIRIFKLQIYIFSLKIELFSGLCKFSFGEKAVFVRIFV